MMDFTNKVEAPAQCLSLWIRIIALALLFPSAVLARESGMPKELRAAGIAKDFATVDRLLSEMWEEAWTLKPPLWIPLTDVFRDGTGGEVGKAPGDVFRDLDWARDSPNAAVAIARYEILYERFYGEEEGGSMLGDSLDTRYYIQVRLQLMRLYYLRGRPAMAETVYKAP